MATTLTIAIETRQAEQRSKALGASIDRLAKSTDKMGGSMRRAEGAVKKTAATAGSAGRIMQRAFTFLASAAFARSIVKTIADFGQEMATLKAVTNETEATLARFNERARELGATTRYTATQAGEAMVFLARAGFSADEVLKSIGPSLDLASAGVLSLAEAADYASNIVSQFGLGAEGLTHVVDVMVVAANSSNTSVRQLAEAMKFTGAVAGAMGIPIEQVAAAIGVLGDSGIQASMAGTNLRSMLTGLLAPTTKAKKALEEMGLSVEDLNPEANTLSEIFVKLRDAGFGAEEAVKIFSKRNAAGALIFARSADRLGTFATALEEVDDRAKKASATMESTLAGKLRNLMSAVQDLFLQTGEEGLTGALKAMVITMTEAVRIIAGAKRAWEDAGAVAKILARTVQLAAVALGAMVAVRVGVWAIGTYQNLLLLSKGLQQVPLAAKANLVIMAAVGGYAVGDLAHSSMTQRAKDDLSGLMTAVVLAWDENRLKEAMNATFAAIITSFLRFWGRLARIIGEGLGIELDKLMIQLKEGILTLLETADKALPAGAKQFFGVGSDLGGDLRRSLRGNEAERKKLGLQFGTETHGGDYEQLRLRQEAYRETPDALTAAGSQFMQTMREGAPKFVEDQSQAADAYRRERLDRQTAYRKALKEEGKATAEAKRKLAEINLEILVSNQNLENQEMALLGVSKSWDQLDGKLNQAHGYFQTLNKEATSFATIMDTQVGSAIDGSSNAMADISVGARSVAEAFSSLVTQMQRDLVRLASTAALSGIGDLGISVFKGFFKAPAITAGPEGLHEWPRGQSTPKPGAQHGGSFLMSGPQSGFAAPLTLHGSERVDVTPMGRGRQDSAAVVVNITNQSRAKGAAQEANNGRGVEVTISDMVAADVRNGGSVGKAIRQSFNLSHATARRG